MMDESTEIDIAIAQRIAFLTAYETRTSGDSIFTLARRMSIPKKVVHRWLADPQFVSALHGADAWRSELLRDTFMRGIQAVADNMMSWAQSRTRGARQAAVWVARCMGMWTPTDTVGPLGLTQVNIQQNNLFVEPTRDQVASMLRERDRVNRIIEKYVKPREIEGGGNGSHEPPAE